MKAKIENIVFDSVDMEVIHKALIFYSDYYENTSMPLGYDRKTWGYYKEHSERLVQEMNAILEIEAL